MWALWFLGCAGFCAADLGSRFGFGFGGNTQFQLGMDINQTLNPVMALHPQANPLFAFLGITAIANGHTHSMALTG